MNPKVPSDSSHFVFCDLQGPRTPQLLRTGRAAPTTLLSCTSGLMVSCTTNHVALRRMKAVIRFQWMMFLRHRMLLERGGTRHHQSRGTGDSAVCGAECLCWDPKSDLLGPCPE